MGNSTPIFSELRRIWRSNGPLRLLQFGMLIKVDTPSLLDSVNPPKESNSLLIKIMTRSLSLSLSQWTDLADLEQAPSTSKLTLETENLSSLLLSASEFISNVLTPPLSRSQVMLSNISRSEQPVVTKQPVHLPMVSVSFLTMEILILLPSGHLCRFQLPGLLQI